MGIVEDRSVSEKDAAGPGLLVSAVVLLALALLWGVCGTLSPGPPATSPTPRTVTVQTASALSVAGSFLGRLNRRELGQAHALLSARLRQEVGREEFQIRMEEYLQSDRNRWGLAYRKVVGEGTEGPTAVVLVKPPGEGRTWEWRLVKDPDGWRIDELRGGPFRAVR